MRTFLFIVDKKMPTNHWKLLMGKWLIERFAALTTRESPVQSAVSARTRWFWAA